MVLRSVGWRIVTLAAVSSAAASACFTDLSAQTFAPTPPADIQATGSVAPSGQGGRLVWGGPVPPAPIAGQAPVYVPSVSPGAPLPDASTAYSGAGLVQPGLTPSSGIVAMPLPPTPDMPASTNQTYPVQDLMREASLPPLDAGRVLDDGGPSGEFGSVPEQSFDPWEGLTEAVPGEPAPSPSTPPASVAPERSIPSYAALERRAPVRQPEADSGWSWNPFKWGRGSLERKTPSGYRALPKEEATCRRALKSLGVEFTEARPVGGGRGCGIQNPVRVTMAADGIAMQPAATLSCQTALQTARWLDDEVRSAARWRLWKTPTSVLNASSYRCSRIAGSRTISEHALGNALDVRGFGFSDGSKVMIEPKGFWERGERKFQEQVRTAGCSYFGTVLGPGYNKAHADHLHLDVKARMRPVCK